jgi:hypothetical protein
MVDPQRDIIDYRKRSKSLGQATQINGRQSVSSLSFLYLRHCEEPTGPACFGGPDDKLRDEAIHLSFRGAMDCFVEPVIGRAFARPVGSQ